MPQLDNTCRISTQAKMSSQEPLSHGCLPCAPQKVYPVLLARFRPAMVGCFWPIFFFEDHRNISTDS